MSDSSSSHPSDSSVSEESGAAQADLLRQQLFAHFQRSHSLPINAEVSTTHTSADANAAIDSYNHDPQPSDYSVAPASATSSNFTRAASTRANSRRPAPSSLSSAAIQEGPEEEEAEEEFLYRQQQAQQYALQQQQQLYQAPSHYQHEQQYYAEESKQFERNNRAALDASLQRRQMMEKYYPPSDEEEEAQDFSHSNIHHSQTQQSHRQQLSLHQHSHATADDESIDEEYRNRIEIPQRANEPRNVLGLQRNVAQHQHDLTAASASHLSLSQTMDHSLLSNTSATSSSSISHAASRRRRQADDPLPGQGRLNEISRRLKMMEERKKFHVQPSSSSSSAAAAAAAAGSKTSISLAATTIDDHTTDRTNASLSHLAHSLSSSATASSELDESRSNLVDALRKMQKIRLDRQMLAAPHLDSSYAKQKSAALQSYNGNDSFLSHSLQSAINSSHDNDSMAAAATSVQVKQLIQLQQATAPFARSLVNRSRAPNSSSTTLNASSSAVAPNVEDMPSFMRASHSFAASSQAGHPHQSSHHHPQGINDLSLSAILSSSLQNQQQLQEQLAALASRAGAPHESSAAPPLVEDVLAKSESIKQQIQALQLQQMKLEQSHQTLQQSFAESDLADIGPSSVTPQPPAGSVLPPNMAFPSGASFLHAASHRPSSATAPEASLQQQGARKRKSASYETDGNHDDDGMSFYLYGDDAETRAEEKAAIEMEESNRVMRTKLLKAQDELLAQQQALLQRNAASLAVALGPKGYPIPPQPIDANPAVRAMVDDVTSADKIWDEVDAVLNATNEKMKPVSHPQTPHSSQMAQNTTVTTSGIGAPSVTVHVHPVIQVHPTVLQPSPVATVAPPVPSPLVAPVVASAPQQSIPTATTKLESSRKPRASPPSQPQRTEPSSTVTSARQSAAPSIVSTSASEAVPRWVSSPLDNLAAARDLERKKEIFMTHAHRKERAIATLPHSSPVKSSDVQVPGAASNPNLTSPSSAMPVYMSGFSNLENQLLGKIPAKRIDLDEAIAQHLSRQTFDVEKADSYDDRYLDHLIAQKAQLFERLQAVELEEAKSRQQQRLAFEMELKQIEHDARDRDALHLLHHQPSIKQPERPLTTIIGSVQEEKTPLPAPAAINDKGTSAKPHPKPAEQRIMQVSSKKDVAASATLTIPQKSQGKSAIQILPVPAETPSLAEVDEIGARARLEQAKKHIMELDSLEDEAREAARIARENEEKEFEEELAMERQKRHDKWLIEKAALEAENRRVIAAQIEAEVRSREEHTKAVEEKMALELALKQAALDAQSAALSETEQWEKQREVWLKRQREERTEWEERQRAEVERQVRREAEEQQAKVQAEADRQLALRVTIEEEVKAKILREQSQARQNTVQQNVEITATKLVASASAAAAAAQQQEREEEKEQRLIEKLTEALRLKQLDAQEKAIQQSKDQLLQIQLGMVSPANSAFTPLPSSQPQIGNEIRSAPPTMTAAATLQTNQQSATTTLATVPTKPVPVAASAPALAPAAQSQVVAAPPAALPPLPTAAVPSSAGGSHISTLPLPPAPWSTTKTARTSDGSEARTDRSELPPPVPDDAPPLSGRSDLSSARTTARQQLVFGSPLPALPVLPEDAEPALQPTVVLPPRSPPLEAMKPPEVAEMKPAPSPHLAVPPASQSAPTFLRPLSGVNAWKAIAADADRASELEAEADEEERYIEAALAEEAEQSIIDPSAMSLEDQLAVYTKHMESKKPKVVASAAVAAASSKHDHSYSLDESVDEFGFPKNRGMDRSTVEEDSASFAAPSASTKHGKRPSRAMDAAASYGGSSENFDWLKDAELDFGGGSGGATDHGQTMADWKQSRANRWKNAGQTASATEVPRRSSVSANRAENFATGAIAEHEQEEPSQQGHVSRSSRARDAAADAMDQELNDLMADLEAPLDVGGDFPQNVAASPSFSPLTQDYLPLAHRFGESLPIGSSNLHARLAEAGAGYPTAAGDETLQLSRQIRREDLPRDWDDVDEDADDRAHLDELGQAFQIPFHSGTNQQQQQQMQHMAHQQHQAHYADDFHPEAGYDPDPNASVDQTDGSIMQDDFDFAEMGKFDDNANSLLP